MCSHIRSQSQHVPLARHGHSRHTVSIHLSRNSVSDSSHREQLRRNVAHQHKPTALQTVSIVERHTLLLKWINRFREIQEVYMPGVVMKATYPPFYFLTFITSYELHAYGHTHRPQSHSKSLLYSERSVILAPMDSF
jgi:hypothetical protein